MTSFELRKDLRFHSYTEESTYSQKNPPKTYKGIEKNGDYKRI